MVWGSTGEVRGWCTVGSQSMSFSHFICLVFVQGAGASPSVASRSELPARSWHSLVGGDGGWETHLGPELALRECAGSCAAAAPQPRVQALCWLQAGLPPELHVFGWAAAAADGEKWVGWGDLQLIPQLLD